MLSNAAVIAIAPTAFGPSATVVTFETGSTGLPLVPGMSFVRNNPSPGEWFNASASSYGFFGGQGASNLVSATYSDIAVEFSTPQGIVGAWLGNIPNFTQSIVSALDIEAFDSQAVSLGIFSVSIPVAIGSSVCFPIPKPGDRGQRIQLG